MWLSYKMKLKLIKITPNSAEMNFDYKPSLVLNIHFSEQPFAEYSGNKFRNSWPRLFLMKKACNKCC